jgi:hypothetical protein
MPGFFVGAFMGMCPAIFSDFKKCFFFNGLDFDGLDSPDRAAAGALRQIRRITGGQYHGSAPISPESHCNLLRYNAFFDF